MDRLYETWNILLQAGETALFVVALLAVAYYGTGLALRVGRYLQKRKK